MKTCPKCRKTYDDSWKVCLGCREKLISQGDSLPTDPSTFSDEENTKRKRPKGVLIFAWLIIVSSFLGLLNLAVSRAMNPQASLYAYLIIYPISIIVGIFLLKSKNWARTAIIIISVIVAVETLATLPYAMRKTREYFVAVFNEQFDTALSKNIEILKEQQQQGNQTIQLDETRIEQIKQRAKGLSANVARTLVIIAVMMSLAFNIGVIYYFTRSPIKSLFN